MKLENKLKNRQLKQHNIAKKQRKEQKKLRQAVKDAAIRTPRPLETYRKRPGENLCCLMNTLRSRRARQIFASPSTKNSSLAALTLFSVDFVSHDALLSLVCPDNRGRGG